MRLTAEMDLTEANQGNEVFTLFPWFASVQKRPRFGFYVTQGAMPERNQPHFQ
jgi:hypothetical protein